MNRNTLYLFTHPDCLGHRNTDDHPEKPDRLKTVLQNLEACQGIKLQKAEARLATVDDLQRAHTSEMIAGVFDMIPPRGLWAVDEETFLSSGSGKAALRAAGACLDAVDLCLKNPGSFAFCAVRPPGHHATRTTPGGFCLFNNVAIAALAAMENKKARRVAILDFDVHHGNGTQDIFWDDNRVLFASLHEQLQDPALGLPDQTGTHNNIINIHQPAGAGGKEWLKALQDIILPRFAAFNPDLLFISAGFDAHQADPLADTNLTDEDYAQMGALIGAFAADRPLQGVITALEGGYNIEALPLAVCAFLTGLVSSTSKKSS